MAEEENQDVNVSGIISLVVFYLMIVGVGLWAARKAAGVDTENVLLAGMEEGVNSLLVLH